MPSSIKSTNSNKSPHELFIAAFIVCMPTGAMQSHWAHSDPRVLISAVCLLYINFVLFFGHRVTKIIRYIIKVLIFVDAHIVVDAAKFI